MEISTPYFPIDYPSDYNVKYLIRCGNIDCQLRIDFNDFQLGLNSVLVMKSANRQLLHVYSQINQPPATIILSNIDQNLIQLAFYANNSTGPGFRAELHFQPGNLSTNVINNYSFRGISNQQYLYFPYKFYI